MSRTRYVNGNITEITVGSHKIFSGTGIENSSMKQVVGVGKKGGVKHGKNKKAPKKEDKISLALVEFRTLPTYTGEFGFDWLRIDDGVLTPEPAYETILKNGYEAPNGKAPHRDSNTEYETPAEAFKALKKQYNKVAVKKAVPPDAEYFIPWLNIFPKPYSDSITTTPKPPCEAELKILIQVDGPDEPDKIRVEFNKTYFEINGNDGSDAHPVLIFDKTIGVKRTATDTLKIKCITEFAAAQEIKVYAYPKGSNGKTPAELMGLKKLAGKIIVGPNDAANRKVQKFVFVNVRTNISGIPATGNIINAEKDNLQNALHQALIHGDFEDYFPKDSLGNILKDARGNNINYMDLSTNTNFLIQTSATGVKTYGKFIYEKVVQERLAARTDTSDGGLYEDYPGKQMFTYLHTQFLAQPGNAAKYANHFTVFCFGDIPYDMVVFPGRGYSGTLGQVEDINKKNVFVFSIRNDYTLNHEGLHGLGLEHTHPGGTTTPSKKFIFDLYETTNIMSYADAAHPDNTKITTWHWQWKIVKSNVR